MACQGGVVTIRQVRIADRQDGRVRAGLAEIRTELRIPPDFPRQVTEEARAAARTAARSTADYVDATAVPLVTIDPEGSVDLDQAVHVQRDGDGWRVRYAIADVAAFVRPGEAVDAEARRRGLTLYAPDGRTPLHPVILCEDAASLLPGQERPAVLWDMRLDADAVPIDITVTRALVRSHARLSYGQVQARVDGGSADDILSGLRSVGLLRQELERARGGVDLPIPEQVVTHDAGQWRLSFRAPLPVEGWNAQISLLTGMVAAQLMLSAGVGVLRTMPPPQQGDLERVRRTAGALGLAWPRSGSYADLIRVADPRDPRHLAFLSLATTLLRGAGYTAFDGAQPESATHAAVAAPYAHVTAPLRRLVDRFGTEVALCESGGGAIPDWVRSALPELPDLMTSATRTSRTLERESINLIEAVLLADQVGETFPAAVVDRDRRGVFSIVIADPGVRAKARGTLKVGTTGEVALVTADPERRLVVFAGPAPEVRPDQSDGPAGDW